MSKTQVLAKGPKCVLSCTIQALDSHLSNGLAEDRPVRALQFYLDRCMSWRENKCFLFVSLKPGHRSDIVPSTISSLIHKTIIECYAQSPSTLLKFHRVKAHQVRFVAASLAFHRQASTDPESQCLLSQVKIKFIYKTVIMHLL